MTNGIKKLDNAKEIVKQLTNKLPKVNIAFSGLTRRKYRKTKKRLRNYCRQKDIEFGENSYINEDFPVDTKTSQRRRKHVLVLASKTA